MNAQEIHQLLLERFGPTKITGSDSAGLRCEIVAKIPAGSTEDQARQMLQNFLIERFHLAYHFQTKVVQGYELRVASGGSKLRESVAGSLQLHPPLFRSGQFMCEFHRTDHILATINHFRVDAGSRCL